MNLIIKMIMRCVKKNFSKSIYSRNKICFFDGKTKVILIFAYSLQVNQKKVEN